MKIDFGEKFTIQKNGFFQYDYGQTIEVYNIGLTDSNLEFQFIQDGEEIIELGTLDTTDNHYDCAVPDKFLKSASDIYCYIYNETTTPTETGKTEKIIILHITAREKYEDIPDEKTKGLLAEVLEKLNDVDTELEEKADKSDVYTKTEIDNMIGTAVSELEGI